MERRTSLGLFLAGLLAFVFADIALSQESPIVDVEYLPVQSRASFGDEISSGSNATKMNFSRNLPDAILDGGVLRQFPSKDLFEALKQDQRTHGSVPERNGPEPINSYRIVVAQPGVDVMRIVFDRLAIGPGNEIAIRSLRDGAIEVLQSPPGDGPPYKTSYFNGETLEVVFRVMDTSEKIDVSIAGVEVLRNPSNKDDATGSDQAANIGADTGGNESLCSGTDERLPSDDPRVGRIMPIGCSGFLVGSGGVIVTAAHCIDLSDHNVANFIEFDVPESTPIGFVQTAKPEDQYTINYDRMIVGSGDDGDDWAAFCVDQNAHTGSDVVSRQGGGFEVGKDADDQTLTIVGYGRDTSPPKWNHTQQRHSGFSTGTKGTILTYSIDTRVGNSGSPVFSDGEFFAVHTDGSCDPYEGGHNFGTSLVLEDFLSSLKALKCE